MAPEVGAIIVAAGGASRMGGSIPKQFRLLGRVPLYHWALHALRSAGVATTVVVVPGGEVSRVRAEVGGLDGIRIVEGGARRRDSVALGVRALPAAVELVLVHDAARPFVPRSLPGRVVGACEDGGVAVPGLPISDTIKRSEDGRCALVTVNRRGLFLAQTPQVCHREALLQIASLSPEVEFTDEAHGAEHLGLRPRMVVGSPFAFKITTEGDFALAETVAYSLGRCWRDHEEWTWVRYTSPD